MSPRRSSSTAGGPYRKPRADLYTALLAIALVALLLGVFCLYLEMKAYQFKYKDGPRVPQVPQAAASPGLQGLWPPVARAARAYAGTAPWELAAFCPSLGGSNEPRLWPADC